VDVDVRERGSALHDAVGRAAIFAVTVRTLNVGDYSIAGKVLLERKSHADFTRSILDGRLFPQAARLARADRAVILLERYGAGPAPAIHPHAIIGAVVSLAVIWRLPVIVTFNVKESMAALEALARQTTNIRDTVLRRYDCKPRRLQSRKLHFLQGLPGIGPSLARRLLERFGSPARAVAATAAEMAEVRGIGVAKAAAIRALLD
jgi:DNA excision repair protein ERCC-4